MKIRYDENFERKFGAEAVNTIRKIVAQVRYCTIKNHLTFLNLWSQNFRLKIFGDGHLWQHLLLLMLIPMLSAFLENMLLKRICKKRRRFWNCTISFLNQFYRGKVAVLSTDPSVNSYVYWAYRDDQAGTVGTAYLGTTCSRRGIVLK